MSEKKEFFNSLYLLNKKIKSAYYKSNYNSIPRFPKSIVKNRQFITANQRLESSIHTIPRDQSYSIRLVEPTIESV